VKSLARKGVAGAWTGIDIKMDPNSLSRSGAQPHGPETGFPRIPTLISLACLMVWLVGLGSQAAQPMAETPLGHWMALRSDHFSLRSLLTYHFLHENWLHLFINVAAISYAGKALEKSWGSTRFSIFYLFSAVAAGLACYLVGLCGTYALSPEEAAPLPSASLGASGAALACLTAYSLDRRDRQLLGWLSERYLIWAGMVVAAALLLFLQETDRAVHPGTPSLLLPQIAGIAAGAGLYSLLPWWSRWSSLWSRSRYGPQRERPLDIRIRVDEILEKISRDGMGSLSREERTFLQDASRHFRNHS
jgi:membrane associated rhomboid family serine protease